MSITLKSGPGYLAFTWVPSDSNNLIKYPRRLNSLLRHLHKRRICALPPPASIRPQQPTYPNQTEHPFDVPHPCTAVRKFHGNFGEEFTVSKTIFVGVNVLRITRINECGGPKVSHRDTALGVGSRSSIPTVYAPVLAFSCTVAKRKCV